MRQGAPLPTPPKQKLPEHDPAAGAQASVPAELPPLPAPAGTESLGSASAVPDISSRQPDDEELPDWDSPQPSLDVQPDIDYFEQQWAGELQGMFGNIAKGAMQEDWTVTHAKKAFARSEEQAKQIAAMVSVLAEEHQEAFDGSKFFIIMLPQKQRTHRSWQRR